MAKAAPAAPATPDPALAIGRTVRALATIGMPVDQIALIVDLDAGAVTARYAKELAAGAAEGQSKVLLALYTKATAGDTFAADLWRKMQPGYYS